MEKKKLFFFSLFTIFYFTFIYYIYYHNEIGKDFSIKLSENWSVSYNNVEVEKNIPIYIGGKSKNFSKGIFNYKTVFEVEKLDDNYVLVFPYVLKQSYKLYINDVLIKSKGDMTEGRSNQWYNPIIARIPVDLLEKKNHLEIEMYSSYESGIPVSPYIKEVSKGKLERYLLYFTLEILPYYQSAIIITLLIIFFYASIKFRENSRENILYFLSLLFFLVYSFDSHAIDTLPIKYIYFKKLTIISFYLSIFCSILYFKRIDSDKNRKYIKLILVLFGIFIISLFLPNDESSFRNIYENGYLFVGFYLFYVQSVTKKENKNKYLSQLKYGYYLLILVAIHDTISLNWDRMSIVLFNNTMFIYIYYSAFLFLLNIISYYEELKIEREKSRFYYNVSRKDPLTGTYNRKRLDELENSLSGEYYVIYFDMDKFKLINDTYGHFAGDNALCEFVKIIKEKLDENIDLVRIGGDEFVLILQEEEKVVEEFINYMLYKSENTIFEYEKQNIKVEFSLGFSKSSDSNELYKIINNADRLLYKIKKG